MDEISYKPIGIIHSPYKEPKGSPIQAAAAKGVKGTIEVYSQFTDGLKGAGRLRIHHCAFSPPFSQRPPVSGEEPLFGRQTPRCVRYSFSMQTQHNRAIDSAATEN